MNKVSFSTLFFPFFVIAVITTMSCKPSVTWEDAPVSVATMLTGKLELLVLSPEKGYSQDKEDEIIVLETPLRPVSELKHYWDGNSVYFGSEKDGAAFTEFGHRDYKEMLYKGKSAKLNSFKQNGEKWFCVIDGILYEEVEGVATAIAECEFRTYRSENGEEKRAFMCRLLGKGEKWHFAAENGKVYMQNENGSLTQVGWMDWHIATLPSGEKVILPMTKNTGKNALWTGKFEGRRYVGK
jgi:hypothetical protein